MKTLILPTRTFIILLIGFPGTMLGQSVHDSSWRLPDSNIQAPLIMTIDTSAKDEEDVHRSHLEAGFSYQNNDVYLGRKDSSVLPYYIPQFTYYHKSGLFASASFSYLKNTTTSRIDLITIDAGYVFRAGNYDGQVTASKYFYNAQSTSVRSEISASLEYENGIDFGFLRAFATGTVNFGSKTDIVGLFGIEHSFYLAGGKMDITPAFAMSGSTQNFYSDYYKKRRFNGKKQKIQTGILSISGNVLNASEFKILDYEPTIPINYRFGKCTISFSPTYSIPVHPATIAIQTTLNDGAVLNKTKTEKIENSFYWTLGFSVLL